MKVVYVITFMNGETEEITLSLGQASYYANELAYKLAKERCTEVSTVTKRS